jgi:hypothetical protein
MNPQEENIVQKQKRTFLSSSQRKAVYVYLCQNCDTQRKIKPGLLQEAADMYNCSYRQVQRIWRKGNKHREDPEEVLKALSPNKKQCGRKPKNLDVDAIKQLSVNKRRTVRALARNIGLPKSTVQRHTN